uniref:Uncharacterized protein n=1 Tax=Oryza nivara TaxID=4536 RepID=A0A0E0IVI7_ORYNI
MGERAASVGAEELIGASGRVTAVTCGGETGRGRVTVVAEARWLPDLRGVAPNTLVINIGDQLQWNPSI